MRKAIFPVLLCLGFLSHCRVPPPSKPRPSSPATLDSVNSVLNKKGVFAEDSLYSCILNLYYQGFSLTQARDECATKLLGDDKKGFDTPFGPIGPGTETYFDPYQVSAACGAGDPRRGQSSSGVGYWPGRGQYTWGGDPNKYHGYAKEDSYKMKEEAVKEWEKANKEFWDAEAKAEAAKTELENAKKTGDKDEIKKAQEKYDAAYKKAQEKAAEAIDKSKKADADPNKKTPGTSRTVDGETPCEQALQSARELLRECQRTQWKNFQCQQLQAKLNHCPDPAQILVDPDQGYTCGAKIDPEAVKDAWVAHCEQLKRYGPDGDNPCVPPTVDNPGRYIRGKGLDVCKGDPKAYIDPGSTDCTVSIEAKPFGQPDIHEIIVFGLNKIGGPIIVIPPKDPNPPRPGPDPRPGPK